MRALSATRWPRYRELRVRVSTNGTIQVQRNTYSVPPRLSGELVLVRIFDLHLEVMYGGRCHQVVERVRGERRHQIDYRHVIWSLVKKPWGFARYRYRDAMFPTASFRRAYEALSASLCERQADLEYLRVLHLAAATRQSEVEAALELLLDEGRLPRFEAVHELACRPRPGEVPEMALLSVDLGAYDDLLSVEVGR